MKVTDLVNESSGDSVITGKIKIPKKKLPDDLSKGDRLDIEHNVVEAYVKTSDEFDIPPTWEVMVNIDLAELAE